MSSPYSALAGKVRDKFPGAYDDLSDDDLGKKVIAKYPEYHDLVRSIPGDVAGRQTVAPLPKVTPQTVDPSPYHEAVVGAQTKLRGAIRRNVPGAGKASDALKNFEAAHPQAVQGIKTAATAMGGGMEVPPLVPPPLPEVTLLPKPKPNGIIRKVAKDVATKYVGKTVGDIVLPEPPPTPEDINYATGKAQVEAGEENKAFDEKAAKQREAAFNKEGDENMAIQKRADDAESARMQAEKVAKNARFKSEQTHAKELRDMEAARQAELTAQAKVRQIQSQMDAADKAHDAEQLKSLQDQMKQAEKDANTAAAQKERLRTMHGNDLMKRQSEQDDLDKAAEAARDEETKAKKAVQKLPPERPGGSGRRPTASERFLTDLTKKPLISLEDDAQGRRYFGKEWELKQGEGHQGRVSRLLGLIRSGRAAQGMRDTSIGPMTTPPQP